MKSTIRITILLLVAFLGWTACKEVAPPVDLEGSITLVDTTYVNSNLPSADQRVVLIEEFTGVQCKNCPTGHDAIRDILTTQAGKAVAVSIHNSNSLATPFTGRTDFRTEPGKTISDLLGGTGAIPCASFNRMPTNNDYVKRGVTGWEDSVTKQAAIPPILNLDLSVTNYDVSTREAVIHIKIHYLQAHSTPNFLSIMFTESNIVEWQLLKDGTVDESYVHNHLLRDMLTPTFGQQLNAPLDEGRVFERDYVYTLPANWDPANVHVIAFVHENGNAVLSVHQAAEAAIQ